ncbi:hypothetical protein MtrunA17_Chr4g0026681 [Medicago truncatula]|uniref:Uncharacterized protein n=1 Tax=Medicago truncatula TaxID=3880 RepID=A0A396I4F9_MEDTR|nr:hypothetical protein MtrunA17_Chr4g0026681 [Medicago truncatula]
MHRQSPWFIFFSCASLFFRCSIRFLSGWVGCLFPLWSCSAVPGLYGLRWGKRVRSGLILILYVVIWTI